MKNKERVLTGVRATGDFHLGNYFGSIQQFKKLQNSYDELFLFIADLHALTNLSTLRHSPDNFEEVSMHILRVYLSFGIDESKVKIYRQSDFPQITELFWIFICLLKENYLKIGHAYKDAVAKDREVPLGTFLYPALMASDILLPSGTIVPVGKDQIQHVEMARDIARKFNLAVGVSYFSEPKELVDTSVATVPGIDGEKMSKSLNNTIPIFSDERLIRERIMSIKTDSTPAGQPIDPTQCIVCNYLELLMPIKKYALIESRCTKGQYTYKELKDILMDVFFKYFANARKKYAKLEGKKNYIPKLLRKNQKLLNPMFDKRLDEIKNLLGIKDLNVNKYRRWF